MSIEGDDCLSGGVTSEMKLHQHLSVSSCEGTWQLAQRPCAERWKTTTRDSCVVMR